MSKRKALRINQKGFVIIRIFVDYISDGVPISKKTQIGSTPLLAIRPYLFRGDIGRKRAATKTLNAIYTVGKISYFWV